MKIAINTLIGVLFGTFSVTATSADSLKLFQEPDMNRIKETHCIEVFCAPMQNKNLIEKFLEGEHTKRMVLADGRGLIIPQ